MAKDNYPTPEEVESFSDGYLDILWFGSEEDENGQRNEFRDPKVTLSEATKQKVRDDVTRFLIAAYDLGFEYEDGGIDGANFMLSRLGGDTDGFADPLVIEKSWYNSEAMARLHELSKSFGPQFYIVDRGTKLIEITDSEEVWKAAAWPRELVDQFGI